MTIENILLHLKCVVFLLFFFFISSDMNNSLYKSLKRALSEMSAHGKQSAAHMNHS